MAEIAAIAACVVLAGLALFQIALVAGMPYGRYVWGGNYEVLPMPMRVASLSSLLIYGLSAVVLLDAAGITDIVGNNEMIDIAPWVVAIYFSFGIMLNGISRSSAERNTMVPISALVAALSFVVAIFA